MAQIHPEWLYHFNLLRGGTKLFIIGLYWLCVCIYREIRTSVDKSNKEFHYSLLKHLRRGTDSVGSRWYNHTHFRNHFINCRTYKLHWRRCWNCPPSLSVHFWHLFIKFLITRCSSPLLMLILPRILRFSSSRVRGFDLYTAFFNERGGILHPGILFQEVFVLGGGGAE